MRRRRNPEIIAGRVNADGSIATGDGFSVQHPSTGLYVITITGSGFKLLSADVFPQTNAATAFGGGAAAPYMPTEKSFGVNLLNSAGAGVDGMFSFTAVGA